MTLNELLTRIQHQKPTAFSLDQKIIWVNELEAQVQEFLGIDREEWVSYTNSAEDKAKTLIVPPPHDVIYVDWLSAKIDYANGDIDDYSNNQMQFFANYHEFKSYAMRKGLRTESLPTKYSNVW